MKDYNSIYEAIKDNCKDIFDKDGYIAPFDVDNKKIAKKLNNSITSVANNNVLVDDVYAFVDITLFGAADNGFLFTENEFYYYPLGGHSHKIPYKSITSCKYTLERTVDQKGKQHTSELITLIYEGGTLTFEQYNIKNKELFAELIEKLKDLSSLKESGNNDAITTDQSLSARTLNDLPLDIQYCYCKLFMNYFLSESNDLSQQKFECIYALLSNLNFTTEQRFSILSYRSNIIDSKELCKILFSNMDGVTKDVILNSLLKDLIYAHLKLKNSSPIENNQVVKVLIEDYSVTNEQINLFRQTYENENKIWDDDCDDSSMEEGLRNVVANAAALGVPLAAIYFTGAVGFSAAGITSGLATLGLGGLFGMSSMVTGIGAVILIGLGAKKGVEHLTGQKEIEKRRRKELMLLQIAKKCQEDNNRISEDINYISGKLSDLINDNENLSHKLADTKNKLQELAATLRRYSLANQNISKDRDRASLYAAKQTVPRIIDVERVNSITSLPTTQKYRDVILSAYEQTDEGMKLRSDITNENVKLLKMALENLGYFSASTALKQTANGAMSKITSFFDNAKQ